MNNSQDRYSAMFRRATRDGDDCPTAESLVSLAAGRAWPWERRRLTDHLGRCSACADDYRAVATARDGLIGVLEAHAGVSSRGAAAWLRSGVTAAALAGVAALGIAVLVETAGPGLWSDADRLASHEAAAGHGRHRSQAEDRLFKSNFGEPEAVDGPLFRDDFGG